MEIQDVRTKSDESHVCHWGQVFFKIPYLFSDVAFGGEVDNVLVFDPPQVQPRPIPVASIYARLGGLEAAAGVVSSAGAVTLSRLCVL